MSEAQLAVFIDFENVALWAEQELLDFELTPLMEYLQSRGPVVVKRAYADWSRFWRYRDEMLNNSIDLTQLYSVRPGKNRADIRMAIDAFEIAVTRSHIRTFVIVSGDSDFGALAAKLREYGRYILGIGPRNITHPLLVKSCDEFVYLETVLNDFTAAAETSTHTNIDREEARGLLQKALLAHGQRGEIPVLAAKLKYTMLSMNSTFNETNLGYTQFKAWLEDNPDIVKLFVKDLQLYTAPADFVVPGDFELSPREPTFIVSDVHTAGKSLLAMQYKQLFTRQKMTSADFSTRRDVLRDIYRELSEQPGERTTDELLDELQQRYETQGLVRSKTTLRQIWQMGFRQRAFEYEGENISVHVPVRLAPSIDSEATLVRRAESGFVYAVVQAGIELDKTELALLLLNDASQIDYIQDLLDDLEQRGLIVGKDGRYALPSQVTVSNGDEAALQPIYRDIEQVQPPRDLPLTATTAMALANTAMVQRSQDFALSAYNYLLACRVQREAVQAGEAEASVADLRWYMASYASVKAGELSQTRHDYVSSRPYYLAFFALVQEGDPLWSRMRGLINPMLAYYWANAGRELGINIVASPSTNPPHQIAILAATHPDPHMRALWQQITEELAHTNSGLLRRVANQIRLTRGENASYTHVAEVIERML